jgi:hypothetical protein
VATLHEIPYSVLSDGNRKALRASLSDTGTLAERQFSTRGSAAGLIVVGLVILGFACAIDFGDLHGDARWEDPAALIFYAAAIGLVAYGIQKIVRLRKLKSLFGFAPGIYWQAFAITDARQEVLKVYDLTKLGGLNVVTHTTNGVYTKTTFTFNFSELKSPFVLVMTSRAAGDAAGVRWEALKNNLRSAAAGNDSSTMASLDPLIQLRVNDWQVPAASAAPRFDWRRYAAVPLAMLLAVTIWLGRNLASDVVMYQAARDARTEEAYTAYIEAGWLHRDDMRDALPRVALDEQLRHASVTGLRAVLATPAAMTLVSAVISLSHSLGLKVIAEGVEHEEQAKMLRLLRCDQMQGYLFSKPPNPPPVKICAFSPAP